jgi:fructan beta-fructosidase
VKELSSLDSASLRSHKLHGAGSIDLSNIIGKIQFPARINISTDELKSFALSLENEQGEKLSIGFDGEKKQYYIDRTQSGQTDFQHDFSGRHVAPRLTSHKDAKLILIIDVSSVELFADNGLTVMTEIFFPNHPYDQLHCTGGCWDTNHGVVDELQFIPLRSIWK